MSKITRRDFLNQAAVTLAGAGLAGPSALAAQRPKGGGAEADLIVVGAGLAGLAATITAVDEGARVVLIDKHYKIGGSAMGAGGSFSAAGSKQQRARNIEDSPAKFFEDANRIGKGTADQELLRVYTEEAAPTQEWLESLGIEFDPKGPRMAPEHELYSIARTCDAKGGGPGYIIALGKQVDGRIAAGKVTLKAETTAKRLAMRGGRVVGVVATDDEGVEHTLYGKAVLLACGGYGSNGAMITRYNPTLANALRITSKYATGDGIRMAEAAGAALVNMDLLPPYFAGVENPPGSGRTLMISLISGIVPNFKGDIWVSKLGKRFMNEDSPSPDARENALRHVPDAAVFAIFDDIQLKSNKPPLFAFDDHLKAGKVVKRGNAIGALALDIGVPAGQLISTIDTYNSYVDAGLDAEFGRKDLVKILVPPFYAIVASGVVFMTMGGVKTNARLQVLGVNGQAIPGLYAAGEVQGAAQWMGNAFMGGAGNGAALVFGRLAAKDAVKAIRP